MVVMGVSSIMPVLPFIAKELHAPLESIGLLITCFTFPGIFLTPLAGMLADRIGRKKVLVPALLIFGLAGSACGFATDLTTLLILRFIQGVGAAPLGVMYATLIGDLYSGKERNKVMGYNASALSLGTAIFPTLGGLLGELGWHWPFFLPAMALPIAIYAMRHLDVPEPQNGQNMQEYFRSAVRLASTKQAIALFSITLLTFCVLYGPVITFLPILGDTQFHMNPSTIGMLFGASSLATAVAASQIGRLTRWLDERKMLIIGQSFYLLSMLLMPFAPSFWWLLIPICFFGLAQGFNFPNLTTLLTAVAPVEQRATIMALNASVLRVAQTIAPMMFTLVYWAGGLLWPFLMGAIFALAMTGITLVLISAEQKN